MFNGTIDEHWDLAVFLPILLSFLWDEHKSHVRSYFYTHMMFGFAI